MTIRQLHAPVAFIIFNRADTTAQVFEAIRQARPRKLLVVADGPRADKPDDSEKCQATRSIIKHVDWPCEVLTNYSDVNLGCRGRVSSGLDWVFDTVEEAIILEDDCLPDPTFFQFCEELLDMYRDDERVMMISGDNFQFGRKRTPYSYYFSHYGHIWGWASWRRAWKKYDVTMQVWPEIRNGKWLYDLFDNRQTVKFWNLIYEKVYKGDIDTWDFQWTFACLVHNGLVILPNSNLISNIGFGNTGTHTAELSKFANMKKEPMFFPLHHPPYIVRDTQADAFVDKQMFTQSYLTRALNKLKRLIK